VFRLLLTGPDSSSLDLAGEKRITNILDFVRADSQHRGSPLKEGSIEEIIRADAKTPSAEHLKGTIQRLEVRGTRSLFLMTTLTISICRSFSILS
jgi:hypothetical protein